MPSYTIDSSPYILNIDFKGTEEEIIDNNDGIVLLLIDDIPSSVSAIVGYDASNNIQVYKPGFVYSNWDQIDNDNIVLRCGGSYIIWSKETASLPYALTIPDCQRVEDGVIKRFYCVSDPEGDGGLGDFGCVKLAINDPRTMGLTGYDIFDTCEENCTEPPTPPPTEPETPSPS
jgi:hypothetical protein